jgi:hypothetical protein
MAWQDHVNGQIQTNKLTRLSKFLIVQIGTLWDHENLLVITVIVQTEFDCYVQINFIFNNTSEKSRFFVLLQTFSS